MTIVASETGNDNLPSVGALRRLVDEDSTLISTDTVELVVVRRPGVGAVGATGATLSGSWDGQQTSVPLAYARVR